MTAPALRLGTRGSDLALWQANHVARLIGERLGIRCAIEIIKTRGDRIQDVAFRKMEGKGFFTKELQDALLEARVDLVVHSLKDLPTEEPDGLEVAAIPERGSPADLLLLGTGGDYTLTNVGNDIDVLAANTGSVSFRDVDNVLLPTDGQGLSADVAAGYASSSTYNDGPFGKLGAALSVSVTAKGELFGTEIYHPALEHKPFSSVGPLQLEGFKIEGDTISGRLFTREPDEFFGDVWEVDLTFRAAKRAAK